MHINKSLFFGSSKRERRLRLQMLIIVVLASIAVGAIVVVGLRQVHHLPSRPPVLFT
jgi:hypothetical protein